MIVKERKNLKPITQTTRHYKLYKDGKHLVTAGIASLSVIGVMAVSSEITVHADTNNDANGAQQTTTGGNAVTATTATSTTTFNAANAGTPVNTNQVTESKASTAGTITQPVNIDHSQLNNAVNQARQAGITVNQNSTTTQTVNSDQVDAAKQSIQNDETKQAQKIQQVTQKYQNENSNYHNFNGSKGDTTQLDAKVNAAQSVSGLTIKRDADQVTTKNADDTQGIQNAVNNATKSNNEQAQTIQNAIDTQKQNNQEYDQENSNFQQKIKSLTTDQHATGSSFFMNGSDNKNGYMKIDYNYDVTYHYNMATDQIIVTNIKINLNREEPTQKGNGFWDTVIFANPNANLPQELGNYYLPNGDLPGINGDSLWNKYGNNNKDVFAFVSQNNQTEQYTIKYNTSGITPYAVNRNSDGTFTLFKTMDRGNLPNHSGNGDQGWHIWWINGNLKKTITVPQAPQRKTSEVHYHYNPVKVQFTPGLPNSVNYQLHNLNVNTTPRKNWVNGIQSVNNKVGINDDIVHARVDMNYLKPSQIDGGLTSLKVSDNYSKYANAVDYAGAQVYENEQNATTNYDIVNTGQQVTATRKNPASANGGKVSLVIDFKIKPGVKTGTVFENSGSGTINDKTVPTNDAQIQTYQQETVKHWMDGNKVVDDKTEINGDIVTTQVHMSLPDQSNLIAPLSYISVDDNYTDFANKVQFLGYQVWENGKNVTDQYNVTNANNHITAVRKNASAAPAGEVVLVGTFKINDNVANGTKLVNRGSGRLNNHTVDTNTPSVVTFTQSVDKHWVDNGRTVDTKTYIADDLATTNITTTLPNPSSLAHPLTYLSIDDDYTDFMNKAQLQNYQVWEGNNNVTSEYTVTNYNGHLTAVRKDASKAPGGTLRLVATWKINDNVPSGTKLTNKGSSRINNHTVESNQPYVVTYTQSTDKHW